MEEKKMKLIKNIHGSTVILALDGDFDSFSCTPFIQEVDQLMEEGVYNIVLNMERIKAITSTGIGSIIKSRKKLKEKEGDLVISAPSPFVMEVLQSLGLTELIPILDDNEQALDRFDAGDGIPLSDGNTVMVHLKGQSKATLVGKIRILEEDRLAFETDDENMKMVVGESDQANRFTVGSEIRLKFRLPLFRKSHYFDASARIRKMLHSATCTRITAKFTQIPEEDQASISQFVKDMQFLRKEARGE
jgi:anti-sigma B factor antagonist